MACSGRRCAQPLMPSVVSVHGELQNRDAITTDSLLQAGVQLLAEKIKVAHWDFCNRRYIGQAAKNFS